MDFPSPLIGFLITLCHLGHGIGGQDAPECGGVLDASKPGYITSPGYPLEYPPHQNCHWIIQAPEPSQRIVLNFNPHFEIERLDCKYDFIEIRDGTSDTADVLGRHCSNIAPPPIISSGSSIQIRFVSDYAHQGAGFSLRYEIFKTGSEFCFRNFTSPSGMIESPGFPDKYPHNLECSYMIMAPPHMDITLTFLTFDLENDPLMVGEGDCKYDWLEVWDGLPQASPLIGRYCGTKIPPEIQSSSGLLSLSFHTDMAVAKDGFSARYNITHKEVTGSFHCSMALGMESGKISDDQITASTTFYDNRWLPRQARLNNDDNAWTPSEDSNKEFIQVDLHFLKVLTGIATQGAISKETQKSYYVTTFKLEVSTNGEDWMVYRHGKNHKIFHANTDPAEVVLNRVRQPVLARFVRIRPQTWKNGIALRFELYGCQITDTPCSDLQGLMSGLLPDAQISVSSSRDVMWNPSTARLVASHSGWFPAPTQPLAGEEWLQVDLGVPKTVRGVITQGARGGDPSTGPATDNRAYVRKYKVAHSLNAKDWNFIMDAMTSQPKIFEGNTQYDTPELRHFEETVAQYIRLYPERWSPGGIGMRVEILGCNLPEISTPADTVTPTLPPSPETTTVPITTTATAPSSIGVCDFDHGLCGWTHDPSAPLLWSLHRHALNSYLYLDVSLKTEQQRARLVSPVVPADAGPLCLLFSYQMWGEAKGHLRVFLRDSLNDESLLWSLHDNHTTVWREGRTIVPRSPKEFQVVIEGFFEHSTRGHIWIDNIHMSGSSPLKECTEPLSAFSPENPGNRHIGDGRLSMGRDPLGSGLQFPERNTASPSSDPPVTHTSEKDNSWLYTLDPILVTIIVMSSLGVLLGAVCAGLLLYCTCSYSGLSSRSSTTLENYNFELYDGLKHKVKLNQQRCCTEA
ncbi:neuropilin-2a isoform X1 [Girardinichthys multiradiatus]|uniref:neuropilin-2a isoform X1 n=1 Tax=Girardinichthys multiradiatus TaxID=208333 RepID=UPI001FACAE2C|nr:neuropilin-2a isoform X1 [Girardinichthys multiradiatus]